MKAQAGYVRASFQTSDWFMLTNPNQFCILFNVFFLIQF